MTPPVSRPTPDLVAAWATGSGIGLMTLMIGWLLGNRIIGLLVGPPVGPTIAFVGAIVVGVAVAILSSRRLVATLDR